jgi:hypothetical protein
MRTFIALLIIAGSTAIGGQSEKAAQPKSVKPLFTLSISSKPVVAMGSPAEVRVRLTNTSTHEMNRSIGNVRGFNPAYVYDVRDQSGNVLEQKQIDPTHQRSAQVITVKPGESRDEDSRISEAYDLLPGTYTIQLSLPVSNDPGADVVKSNKITITVTP